MTPEITSAIALLKAKAKAVGETCDDHHREYFLVQFPAFLDRLDSPTMEQLRDLDITELEIRLRTTVPDKQQEKIRAQLVAEFGRSTVGELFEVVAKRILERGSVANHEEFETVEPFVWTWCQYGIEVLGQANHRRLSGLLEDHRSGVRK